MEDLPSHRRSIQRRLPDAQHLSCAEQFGVMALQQLTYRESLRDIEDALGSSSR